MKKKIFLIFLFIFIFSGISYCIQDKTSRVLLNNGMVLIMTENNRMDIVSVQILIKAGQRQEDDQICGISNFINKVFWEDSFFQKGYFYEFEKMGVIARSTSTPDYIHISCLTREADLSKTLEILYNKIQHLTFSAESIDKVKKEILKDVDNPNNVFNALYGVFKQNFYRYHPYRYPSLGFKKSIEGISKEKLNVFFGKNFIPENMVISITGNMDKNKVVKKVKGLFENIPYKEKKIYQIDWEPPSQENEVNLRLGSGSSWIFLGYSAPSVKSPDYPAMKLLFSLLGDGLSSRIWNELREKRALAYELGAIFPELEGPSHLVFYAVTGPNRLWEAEQILLREVDIIKKYPVSNKELEETKRKVIGKYLIAQETDEGLGDVLASFELYDLGYCYNKSIFEKIQEVTSSDIQRVARFYLNNYTLITAQN